MGLRRSGGFALAATAIMNTECQPSKWGRNCENGAASPVTLGSVLAATKLTKKGETHRPGIVVDPNMPIFAAMMEW